MIEQDLKDIWVPTGLLLGFQVSLFKWRLEREAEVGDKGDIPWLVPSDYLSIFGMLVFVIGAILFPLLGIFSGTHARIAFGIGSLFFVGQALGLAGHYQLFNRTKQREFIWFPAQEKVVVFSTLLASFVFVYLSLA